MCTLVDAKTNTDLVLISIEGCESIKQRLADMGLLPGGRLRVLHNSGRGPVTIQVKGTKIALGYGLASKIIVKEER